MTTKTKTCSTCKIEKPLDAFGKNNSTPDRKEGRCKACKNESTRRWKLRVKQGLITPKPRPDVALNIDITPFDPELEARRHVENLIAQYGVEGAKAKIKLEAFAT